MKKMLIAGNWKMNCNSFEATVLVEYIWGGLLEKILKSEILVCPPFTSLETVVKVLEKAPVHVGAQNCHYEPKGAFTGEISIQMLSHIGVEYVIIGHSERRSIFGEDDELINNKLKAIINADLKPILCIGETLNERNEGKTFDILKFQLEKCLESVTESDIYKITIAYEPVWAIGTGISATREQIVEAHDWLRTYLISKYGSVANDVIILYGGSLNAKNAESVLSVKNVNGGLIGGASLNPEEFLIIINVAENILSNS
ncbi:MAG: triose-phosphate isomerase [Candidatus Kapabacteria bacterium]|nr:triose-phosphate isomerase [Candidatus Kapabacteria bacterium]